MGIKAIVFDLDGTIVDTITDISNAMNLALDELSLPNFTEEEYKYLVGSGLDRLVDGVLPKEMSDEETVNDFVERFRKHYSKKWLETSIPFEGIAELLDSLKMIGIKMAVFSNKPHASTVAMIETILPNRFEVVYGERLDEGIPKKPDPTMLLRIAQELSVSPSEIIYVGDSDVDMQVSVNAGMIGVGVLWGFRTEQELVNNGATYIVAKPADIMDIVGGKDDNYTK